MATSDVTRGATSTDESKNVPDEDLEAVLKHAEHGSVEDFAKAFYFARLDIQSALQRRAAYDFGASKQYLRVLAVHQRRDILTWLLENHEVVESMVNVLILEACKHSSTDFLAWLETEVSKYFNKGLHPAEMFGVALEHGSVEVASAILRKSTSGEVLETYTFSKLHPNVVNFWRENCCSKVMNLHGPSMPRDIKLLIEANDAENLAFVFDHVLIQQGVATLAESKGTVTAGVVTKWGDVTTWMHVCHGMVNMCLKLGHWKCAKVILTAIDRIFVDLREEVVVTRRTWSRPISYFCVDYPERMSDEDVAEMVEWTMSRLKALWTMELEAGAAEHGTNRSSRDSSRDSSHDGSRDSSSNSSSSSANVSDSKTNSDGTTSSESDPADGDDLKRFLADSRLAYEIASAFIHACDSGIEAFVSCFTEDKELYRVVRTVFNACNTMPPGNTLYIFRPQRVRALDHPLRRAATIQTLLEHGLSAQFIGSFTNIGHVWGKDREWMEWAISGNLHSLKERTGHLDTDVLKAFNYLHYDILDNDREPFASMTEEEQFKFLKWFIEAQTSFDTKSRHIWRVLLKNRYVTADNVVALVPEGAERARAVGEMIRHPDLYAHVSLDVFNALAQSLTHRDMYYERIFMNDLHSHAHLDDEFETTNALLGHYLPFHVNTSRFLVHALKVLVLRLQATLNKRLVLGAGEGLDPRLSCVCESKESAISVPLDQRQQQELLYHDNWRVGGQSRSCSVMHKNLQVYRGLGFYMANDPRVLEFGLAHWFLNGKDMLRPPSSLQSISSTLRHPGDTAKHLIQVFSFPIFPAVVHEIRGNLTMFRYWREYLGLDHTPGLYVDAIWSQTIHWHLSTYKGVDFAMRNLCFGMKAMRRELGVYMAPGIPELVHNVIFRYCGLDNDTIHEDLSPCFVDVSSLHCAFLMLLEEVAVVLEGSDTTALHHHSDYCSIATALIPRSR